MKKDFMVIVVKSLLRRKLRSWLTMLGIFIGIAAVVSLVSLGQGLQKRIDDEFAKLGADKLMIMPKGNFGPPGSSTSAVELTEDDWEFVKSISGVKDSTVSLVVPAKVEFKNEVRYFNVIGLPVGEGLKLWMEMLGDYDIEGGRNLRQGDKYKIVVGNYFINNNMFSDNVKLRDTLKVNGFDFKVIGYWELIGSSEDDKQLYVALDTARDAFNVPERVDTIIVRTEKGQDPGKVAELVKRKLRQHRGLEEGKEDFSVQTFEEVLKSVTNVLSILQVVLVAIAAISLVVGGIGIMNTMFTSVLERTKEIGIMKAIGARNSDIAKLFLIESGLLGMAGGIIGILLGIGISEGIVIIVKKVFLFTFLDVYFPWYLIVGMLLFSFVVGSLSGLLPAMHAAKQKPVDALRYE